MAITNYVFLDQNIGKDSPSATGTVQLWPVGMTAGAKNINIMTVSTGASSTANQFDWGFHEFVYMQGSTNAAGHPVIIQNGVAKALATAVNNGSAAAVGIAAAAMTNTGVYGWVQVRGVADYAVAAVALGVGNQMLVPVNATSGLSTAAAGSAVVALRIANMYPASSVSASTTAAPIALVYPFYPGA